MRKKKVEGEYQTDSWPKGPEWSLCPLARPDIAMGLESQIEAWSARSSRSLKTPGSHRQIASNGRRITTVSKSETTCHRLRGEHPAERRRGLGCQGKRHRGRGRNTLDIPLHRRNLWARRHRGPAQISQIPPLGPCGSSVGMTARMAKLCENGYGIGRHKCSPCSIPGDEPRSGGIYIAWGASPR